MLRKLLLARLRNEVSEAVAVGAMSPEEGAKLVTDAETKLTFLDLLPLIMAIIQMVLDFIQKRQNQPTT